MSRLAAVSEAYRRGRVTFPAFTGERVYMREFTKAAGLPADLARWQETVDQMLDGVDANGPVFLMIDQAAVSADSTHRRTGVHVDNHWVPGKGWDQGQWITAGKHGDGHAWAPDRAESIILAASHVGCRAYVGRYDGEIGAGGDCSRINTSGLRAIDMDAGIAWAGNTATMLHESIPVALDCLRTVVRLNVPGWLPGPRS